MGLAAAGATAAWCAPASAPVLPAVADALGLRTRLGRPGVALTFDDGPHAKGTPAVLELLAQSDVTATFFLVGEQVERLPALSAEIAAAGHEIGLHGYRHRLLLRRTTRALTVDLDRCRAVIEDATQTSPRCYRPPYGVFSAGGLRLCRRRGWEPTLWSRWGRDWGALETPEAIAERATSGLRSRDIVLLHDADHYSAPGSWRRTVAALPAILERVLEHGELLVTVSG